MFSTLSFYFFYFFTIYLSPHFLPFYFVFLFYLFYFQVFRGPNLGVFLNVGRRTPEGITIIYLNIFKQKTKQIIRNTNLQSSISEQVSRRTRLENILEMELPLLHRQQISTVSSFRLLQASSHFSMQ